MAEVGDEIWVSPRDIYFSQNDIDRCFRSGSSIAEKLWELLQDEISPEDFPMMRVCRKENGDGQSYYISFDNRRLALFR